MSSMTNKESVTKMTLLNQLNCGESINSCDPKLEVGTCNPTVFWEKNQWALEDKFRYKIRLRRTCSLILDLNCPVCWVCFRNETLKSHL